MNIDYITNYMIANPNATIREISKETYKHYKLYMKEDEHLSLVAKKLKARWKKRNGHKAYKEYIKN